MTPALQRIHEPSAALARAGALAAILFWGSSFVATKTLLRELTPLDLVFARSAVVEPRPRRDHGPEAPFCSPPP